MSKADDLDLEKKRDAILHGPMDAWLGTSARSFIRYKSNGDFHVSDEMHFRTELEPIVRNAPMGVEWDARLEPELSQMRAKVVEWHQPQVDDFKRRFLAYQQAKKEAAKAKEKKAT
jgi:hypothetical protein